MGDAVLHVRGRLRGLARDNWAALEQQHARNVSQLRAELAKISRSLELKARFEACEPAAAPFPRCLGAQCGASGGGNSLLDVDVARRELEDALEPPRPAKKRKLEPEKPSRLSTRLRARADGAPDARKNRKRGRPSQALLQDPAKLKVAELRSELKKRGLRTSGLKAVLFDRLLDALEEEQKEDQHLPDVQEEDDTTGKSLEHAIVVDDGDEEDEIVRESVGSNKSQRSYARSQSTSPKAAVENATDGNDVDVAQEDEEKAPDRSPEQPETHDGEELDAEQGVRTKETPVEEMETADTAVETEPANSEQPTLSTKTDDDAHNSKRDVEFTISSGAEDLITHDDMKLTRKSMQLNGKSELSSPLAWKRKSILRKASSLAPGTRGLSRKVSFAPTDKVDTIVESSQTDSTQPDPSPEKSNLSIDAHTPIAESKTTRSDSIPEAGVNAKSMSTPEAPVSSTSPVDLPAQIIPENETEEQRKKREFEESVQREAQKLRMAAKLSAQKRLEEAKASKAFWAKRDQLRLKLRASSTVAKTSTTHTPTPLSDNPAFDRLSPPTSETSTATDSASVASAESMHSTKSASKDDRQTQQMMSTPQLDAEEAKDHDFMQSVIRHHEIEDISNVSSAFESTLHEAKDTRSTHSSVVEKDQGERLLAHRLHDKSADTSIPATAATHKDGDRTAENDRHQPQSSFTPAVSSLNEGGVVSSSNTSELHGIDTFAKRNRSDSLSSTVSSIPEPSVIERALKSGSSTNANGTRKPIANLVSGLHSFTTLMAKDSSHDSSSVRSAPVVNSLKLAEKSRALEEKKRLEKEKRKAILKKKMEEHKKAAALKEQAEKDAEAKREQERLNERKKREAELARKRQQKLKEMRAGLEKKRAMMAAEKKASHASNAALTSKPSATSSSHYKHRGLASVSEAPQPNAKAASSKTIQKPVSKLLPKPVSKPALVSQPASKPMTKPTTTPMAKPAPEPLLASPAPAKQAPISHSPEIVNYEMSDNANSSDGDSSDSDSERHGKKKVPKWAQKHHLNKILHAQFGKNAVDPSPAIFQDFVDTCNLEAIFEPTDIRKKKKFARRTSSGNWLADRPTARDRALYQRDMGYDR